MGNTAGGACVVSGTGCTTVSGRGNAYDWSAMVKYEVLDEDLEVSVNLIRHVIDAAQDPASGYLGFGTPAGSAYTTYDIFAKKKVGKVTLGGEIPIVSGDVAGVKRSTVAMAAEVSIKPNNSFDALIKAGRAPGAASFSGTTATAFNAFFFNPNYRLGLVMFNYALGNFAKQQSLNTPGASSASLASPFDNPVVNANYFALATSFNSDKWQFRPGFVIASADQAAVSGLTFYNTQSRQFVANAAGKDQGKFLGTEFDFTVNYQMDDAFSFGIDTGVFFPGSFYKFSNAATDNNTSTMFANVLRVGVTF